MRPRSPPAMPIVAAMVAAALLQGCGGPARAEVEPAAVRLYALGQMVTLRARLLTSSGERLPREACTWSVADRSVATVDERPGGAVVVSVGPGATTVTCRAGSARADVPVTVRVASRIQVEPPALDIALRDEPAPALPRLAVVDTEGKPLLDRPVSSRCGDESVCRGDDRGQVWPVGGGSTVVTLIVDGAAVDVPVRVRDERTAEGRPRAVKGNPMLDVERAMARPPARREPGR